MYGVAFLFIYIFRHQAVFNPSRRGSIVATTKNVILIDVVALLMIVPYSVHLEVGSGSAYCTLQSP
jgi:hypothetical protein